MKIGTSASVGDRRQLPVWYIACWRSQPFIPFVARLHSLDWLSADAVPDNSRFFLANLPLHAWIRLDTPGLTATHCDGLATLMRRQPSVTFRSLHLATFGYGGRKPGLQC